MEFGQWAHSCKKTLSLVFYRPHPPNFAVFSIRYLHLSFMSADIARYRHKCNYYVENHTQKRVSLFQPVCKNKAAGKPVYSCVF